MTRRSQIYSGKLMHERIEPLRHSFDYPVFFYKIDLEELDSLAREIPLLGYNRPRPVSFYDRDFLARGDEPVREKVKAVLQSEGLDGEISRIELVTCLRYFGHVFNPVSFFFCYDTSGETFAIITQVNNTFDESHLYVLKVSPEAAHEGSLRFRAPKEFHVSPFLERKGEYEFRFSGTGETLNIQINLFQNGKPVLLSRLTGKGMPLTLKSLGSVMLRFPVSALLTLPRIHLQAAKLYFQKKLPVFKRRVPSSPKTIRTARPGMIERICMKGIRRFLSKIKKGRLQVLLPEGEADSYGTSGSGRAAQMDVKDYRLFRRLARDAGIGLGESYMEEEWESPDLTGLLLLLIENKPYLDRKTSKLAWVGERLNRLRHTSRRNSVINSKKNIGEHYDLGNDFYSLFLDESMTYSAGFFKTAEDTLQQAQENKLARILRKARITRDCHVLEIGCGWGAFAIKAVKETGCRVTGITLSEEQFAWAARRVREEGLESRIEIKLCDYRHIQGSYDRIVSIEMLEAVGYEYLGAFFGACDRLLKREGLLVLQVITIPDQRYESYRHSSDWIQKHIFPGGHLPSLSILCHRMTQASELFVEDLENIGIHYARTLREWRLRFEARKDEMLDLGFSEKFFRAWRYYFSYCEAAFASRYLNDLQLVLTRVGNSTLDRTGEPFNADNASPPQSFLVQD